MSVKEETGNKGLGCCESFMSKCFKQGSEENAGKFDFKSCEQMMKQFCAAKDGKFDFEACRSKFEECCKNKD
jgi:hypothetical protein